MQQSGRSAWAVRLAFGHQGFNQLNHFVQRAGWVGLVRNLDMKLVFNLKQKLNDGQRVEPEAFQRCTGQQFFFSYSEGFSKKINQIRIHQ